MVASMLFISNAADAQSKTVDVQKSELSWKGKKVTGEHSGNINFKSGVLEFEGDELAGGEFVVDMNSITCTDLKDEGYNQKLVAHLKSDDFFGVESYPVSRLVLTSVEKSSNGYLIHAELTIKSKTNPVEFEVSREGDVFKGTMVVDRSQHNVRYGSGKFFDNLGDKMIYDDFELSFKVVAK